MSASSSSAHARQTAKMAEAFIALGGNVGDVRSSFDQAIAALCDDGTVRLLVRSSDYRTPPWGVTEQPPFINAVISVATTLDPHALLSRAQECERALGRNRAHEQHWGPRHIDLDLLTYDDLAIDDATLTLPHPHMFERAFVLVPLAEIAPDRIIGGLRVRDALARVDPAGIEKLPAR
jgi:2-amino-4-hydroxy-6-hydroxymethyldihydropteridine diphosphokinase